MFADWQLRTMAAAVLSRTQGGAHAACGLGIEKDIDV
jgi:hypothetical protein